MKLKTGKRLAAVLAAIVMLMCGAALAACTDRSAADKTALAARIEYVETNYAGNDDAEYTEESFAELTAALAEAKAVNQNANATQEQIDAALADLNAAVEGLVKAFQRAYNIDYLPEFIAGIGYNYTLNVTDYSGETEREYRTYYTDRARYYENQARGIASYDGYVHHFTYDADGNVSMGNVFFKEDATPMVYLYEDEMRRVFRSLGDIAEYEIWGSASFANLKNTNIYISTEEIYIETFAEVAIGWQFSEELAARIGGTAVEIVKEGETETLVVWLYGEHYLDPILAYTVTDVGTTCLEKVDSYIAEHPEYTSASDPVAMLEEFYDLYYWEDAVRFNVYTAAEGTSEDRPDYTVTAVDMDNTYWYSTKEDRARLCLSGVKLTEASLESGSVALGSEAAFNRYAISFYTYLVEKREAYVNAQGTDEWFIDLTQNAGVKDFAVRFFDVNDANAALITKISIGVNSDGRLVVTLWRDYSGLKDWDGVILRAVLVESSYAGDEVKVDAIEAYFQSLESLEELEKAIADAKAIESELYTEASYAALQTAIADAEAVAAKGNCTVEEISEASGRLASAIQSLVKRASLQDVAELNNLLLKAGFYTESKYTQASYAALSDAVAAAQELLNAGSDEPSALQERIDALASAIDGLVLAVDKAELNALIALIQELNTEDCTAESRAALMSALAAAQEVSGNAEAAQADVDGAVQALEGARLELKLAASSRAALEAALGEVGGIGNDDASYTQESYDAFAEVRTLAAEALVDSDLSEEDCLALIHMLNGRYSELERTDFVADGTTAASIKNWIDNTFCDGLGEYMGIAVSGYSFTVEYPDGAQKTYVSKVGKYFYDVTAQNGYIKTEKLIHQFALENGAVVLGDACFNLAGTYLATYFSHVGISDVGYFSGALTRIGNSNEWFSTDTRWISFVPGLNGVYGVGFILQDDALTVKVYAGAGLAATPAANRTELLCTVTFDRIGSAGVAELDAFLAGGIRAGQAEVVQALQLLRDNYAMVNLATGARIIRTENYYFDGKEGYILKDGKVHQLFYIEGAYRIGGVVYVNGQQATSIDQLVPSVSGLKAITAEQLSLFYDDWYETQVEASYYLVTDASGEVNAEIAALMAQLAGLTLSEDESMPCLSFSVTGSGCICIVEGDMTGVRPDNFYTFTEVGSASDAEIEALLN